MAETFFKKKKQKKHFVVILGLKTFNFNIKKAVKKDTLSKTLKYNPFL